MTPYEIICKKRDGQVLTQKEIEFFVDGYLKGEIKDYQMSVLLMAIYFKGMSYEETFHLTRTYIQSGITIDFSDVPGNKVDKHSTGGVGDKVSIILAPLVASIGVKVPMISGRGLGHSGGTLDKLESIPGFRTNLSIAEFKKQIQEIGVSMIGQTEEIVPADKRIYALRDVTGTVESIPLITASIMSKKIAEGIDALVLDVKYGNGAFMSDVQKAEALAKNLIRVGKAFGKNMTALLTSMEQPLGHKIGNWLEIEECLDGFQGRGPADLMTVTIELAARMVLMGDLASTLEDARKKCEEALSTGKAFQKFLEMARYQGADVTFLENPQKYPKAKFEEILESPCDGFVTGFNTKEVGLASVVLGAGRLHSEDEIDPTAGIISYKKIGDPVLKGEPLFTMYTNKENSLKGARHKLQQAIRIGEQPDTVPELILKEIGMEEV